MLRLKCTKFDFRSGSAPDSTGGTYSAPPDSIVAFKGAYVYGEREGNGRGRAGEGGDGEEEKKRRGK